VAKLESEIGSRRAAWIATRGSTPLIDPGETVVIGIILFDHYLFEE
jgi:hypothetical protein